MTKRIYLFNIPVDSVTLREAVNLIDRVIYSNRNIYHMALNAAKITKMLRDEELFNAVVNADLITADGMSIVWLSRFLGHPLPERVTGIDLMDELVKVSYKRGYKIFFFGAKEEVVRKVVNIYSKKYSPKIIAEYRNGYYSAQEEEKIVENIISAKPNIVFVAMSTPKKEKFIYKYKDIFFSEGINFLMGVGGSFDVIAGKVKRAPLWMQKAGLEWFYRFLQEPKRMWKRVIKDNSEFIYWALKEYLKSKVNAKK
jgi:N-acetylglucosaminyldiphosphoundecaprenol N-acetyl-beta-D-mannosaminyltransferase